MLNLCSVGMSESWLCGRDRLGLRTLIMIIPFIINTIQIINSIKSNKQNRKGVKEMKVIYNYKKIAGILLKQIN